VGLYARSFSDVYAEWYDDLHDRDAILAAVRSRVGATAVIVELGSGSGHIAGPLADDGHTVLALDSSTDMLRQDRSASLCLAADMAASPIRTGTADLAIIAWNTLFNVTPLSRQDVAIAEAARALRPGGWLVVEAFVAPPDVSLAGISVRPHHRDAGAHVVIATHQHPERPAAVSGVHIEVLPTGTVTRPWQLAYRSPSEIDAAARDASLRLVERCADWGGAEFDPHGARHVSWYQTP